MPPERMTVRIPASARRPAESARYYAASERFVNCPRQSTIPHNPVEADYRPFQRVAFIFITEFCGSTALARAFSTSREAVVVNEPVLFADALRGTNQNLSRSTIADSLAQCAHSAVDHSPLLIIKEQGVSNLVASTLVNHRLVETALVSTQSLEGHILACLRVPPRLKWKMRVLSTFLQTRPDLVSLLAPLLSSGDDFSLLACEWLANQHLLSDRSATTQVSVHRVYKEEFLDAPSETLSRLGNAFGLRDLKVQSQLAHSKDAARSFDFAHERSLESALHETHGERLARVIDAARHIWEDRCQHEADLRWHVSTSRS